MTGATPEKGARRHYLSIMFADLSDSMRLAASMEAEQYAEIVDGLRQACRRIIPIYGGSIVQLLGDGVLAIFGYPVPQEGDGRRATQAALELHDTVRNLRLADSGTATLLHLHTGIHSGLVLVAEGDAELGRYQLVGNTPNIAARLASAAQRDEILVTRETLGPDCSFFKTGELHHINVKGVAEPLAVYRVLARTVVETRFEASIHRGLAPLIGREAEARTLERALADALAGTPRCVVISAPAGMGKTRLVEEFLRRAARSPCQIHRGYCESHLGAEPLQPFLQMLRAAFGLGYGTPPAAAAETLLSSLAQLDPALTEHAPELLRALSLGGTARVVENHAVALAAVFRSFAAQRPQIIFIDDWQSADDATQRVLEAVRNIEHRSVLVLLATRAQAAAEVSVAAACRIELQPFSEQETSATIASVLPRTDPFVAQEIFRLSGGNPLFIEELCHCAAHEPLDRHVQCVRYGAAWLDSLIASRVQRLPQAQADLVSVAAVIGNVIPVWLFAAITGHTEGHPLVTGLADQDFVFPDERPGALRFKHGLTREAVYRCVGLSQRRPLHLRIAQLLRDHGGVGAEEEHYEALAYHYGAGGQASESARYAQLAGNKAMANQALDRAQQQYRAALTALEQLPPSRENDVQQIVVAQQLAEAYVFDPAREPLPVLHRAAQLAKALNDREAMAKTEYWLGYLNYGLGEPRASIQHCERALQTAEHLGDDKLLVQIRATLGQALVATCDYQRALPLLDEAILIKRRHRTGARPAVGLSYTLTCKAAALGDRGLFAQAYECFEEAEHVLQGTAPAVKASLFCRQSAVCTWQGDWQRARQAAAEAGRVAERVKSLYLFAMCQALIAYTDWVTRADPQALEAIRQATYWLEQRGRRQYISLNYGWLTELLVADGRVTEARSQAARAMLRARKRDSFGEAMVSRALARAAARHCDREQAAHYLAHAARVSVQRESRHELAVTQLCAAEITAAQERRSEALELLDQASAAFTSMGMHWHLQQAQQLRQRCE